MKPLNLTLTSLLILAGAAASAADVDVSKLPPAAGKTGVTYAQDIKPILEPVCFKCHGVEKQKGKLRLDSLAAALKGGGEGKVIQPGDSAKSALVRNVARIGHEDTWMPPADKGKPLSKEQIGLIRAWIDQGAK